ncbi:MAG: Gfo/Idh/MocA family oxidoreductase, partial [Bacteroidota bacterium]
KKVYTVLQLRVHPSLIALKEKIISIKNEKLKIKNSESAKKTRLATPSRLRLSEVGASAEWAVDKFRTNNSAPSTKHKVTLQYITSRGLWYNFSWKGDKQKSGGIATNIGIHLFDLLIWLFGDVTNYDVIINQYNKMSGTLELKNADVEWFLSIDRNDLPGIAIQNNKSTFRSIMIDGNEIEFTEGFTNLHTVVYQEILNGKGFGIQDSRPSIELVYKLRNCQQNT